MSMNHEIRIRVLEKEVELLAASFRQLLDSRLLASVPPESSQCYVKRGFQGYYVYSGSNQVNDKPLKKIEAEQMADDLNRAAA